ncbi:MAG: HEAT repeat domain-containing protein [Phycisphaerae bacterium]|nr:HEAT repeat domain-containing protein [Phycisphaerae bacterium]
MSEDAAHACKRAAERADRTLAYYPLQKYKNGGGVYENNTGFCPRIAQGDIAQRDRYLRECWEKTQALGRMDVPEGQDSIPTPTIDDVPKLVAALADDSRCVRRFAVNALGKLGPAGLGTPAVAALIKALTDEDEWVRAFAAQALGETGAPEATAALTKATSDDSEAVRKAATGALRKLRGS